MSLHPKLLNEGEHVLVATRTHGKVLLLPVVTLLLLSGVVGFVGLGLLVEHPTAQLVLIVLAGIVFVWRVLWPFLTWWNRTYVFTNRRLITRRGVFTRRGHDIPLNRISDVSYERGVTDRILGCGTLVMSDASEHGRVELYDIPRVEQVQLRVSDQLFQATSGRGSHDDGT